MKPGKKSQIIILQGLKGRHLLAMGIAHGGIVVPFKGLKGRHPIATGIPHVRKKTQKKTSFKTGNI